MAPAENVSVSLEMSEGFAKTVGGLLRLISRDGSPPIELNSLTDATGDQGRLDVTEVTIGAFCGTAGQEIVDDVYDTANTTNNLDLSFERVYRLLLKIDSQKYTREDGSIVEYAKTWREYHEVSIIIALPLLSPHDIDRSF
jgi:hypothetical protein